MAGYFADLAAILEERLGLDLPPVALTLVSEQPPGIARAEDHLPAACSFWRRAEHGTFYAGAEDHLNCPIGALVMGFQLSEVTTGELMGLVQQMCSISYIKPEEVPYIPKFEKQAIGIVYGPLAQFPLEPDAAIVWATPQQAMILQEAVGAAEWSESPAGVVLGRPACGVLPAAAARGKPTVSLGCAGMRTFTEILPDRLLIAIPGAALDTLADQIRSIGDANDQMVEFYRGRKATMNERV